MRELIESKIKEWQQGLDQLQAQRVKFAQQLAEIDAAIQRNAGAIAGAKDLLDADAQEHAVELTE